MLQIEKANPVNMLTSFVLLAWRHLMRNKIFSFINITGMAAGLPAFVLIAQYIDFQLQFDQYHAAVDDIVRVKYTKKEAVDLEPSSSKTFFGVADYAKQNSPEVQHNVHIYKWSAHTGVVLAADAHVFNEKHYLFVEPEFFLVFRSLLKQGSAAECLKDPKSIVLSERLAMKMFGRLCEGAHREN